MKITAPTAQGFSMKKHPSKAQRIRMFIIVFSALAFPLTMIYFSPGMVFRGARTGVLSGSYITFALLFFSALFLGRAWCGWACPVAGFCEFAKVASDRPYRPKWAKKIKYVIWVIWLIAIALVATFVGGGFHSVDPLLGTDRGVSIHSTSLIAAYYMVVGIIFASMFLLGRRGFCHTFCWMAPFMVLGRKLSNRLNLPALRLGVTDVTCRDCKKCEQACPMDISLSSMVKEGDLEHPDCILCGACVGACSVDKIQMGFARKTAR